MRLVYYGTPALAVPALRRLVQDGRAPLLVVTRPDRPKGRGLATGPSPVKAAASSLGLEVATPLRAGAPAEIERVRALEPDLIVLTAYGQILPPALLAVPRLGALNVHFSLLPRHRGAAPIQAAILEGDRETGVSTMWMTEGLDEGPVFLSRAVPIGEDEDAGALASRLAELGAACLSETLDRIGRGEMVRAEQHPARATVTRKLGAADARLRPEEPPDVLVRRVRAFAPEPGAYLLLEAPGVPGALDGTPAPERLLVLEAAVGSSAPREEPPGTVLGVDRARGVEIALPAGSLWLKRVKPAGRRAMDGAEYANGRRLRAGSRLALGDAIP
jgi:methionyl-tRNA formyltransferase